MCGCAEKSGKDISSVECIPNTGESSVSISRSLIRGTTKGLEAPRKQCGDTYAAPEGSLTGAYAGNGNGSDTLKIKAVVDAEPGGPDEATQRSAGFSQGTLPLAPIKCSDIPCRDPPDVREVSLISGRTLVSDLRKTNSEDSSSLKLTCQASQGPTASELHPSSFGLPQTQSSLPLRNSGTLDGEDNNTNSFLPSVGELTANVALRGRSGSNWNPVGGLDNAKSMPGSDLRDVESDGKLLESLEVSEAAERGQALALEEPSMAGVACDQPNVGPKIPSSGPIDRLSERSSGDPARLGDRQPPEFDAYSSRKNRRNVAFSVAPFVPSIGRPTRAVHQAQKEKEEPVKVNIERSEQRSDGQAEGSAPNFGRRVSLALRSAYSTFSSMAPSGKQQPAQREGSKDALHAAVGWLRGRSSSEITQGQEETITETEESKAGSIYASLHNDKIARLGRDTQQSKTPVAHVATSSLESEDIPVDVADRQALAFETKRWGRRFTAVNTHEPRAVSTGPALNPYRRSHRTEQFSETQVQPIPKKQ